MVLLESMHTLRTGMGHENPALARALIRFLTRENVEVADADKAHLIAALERAMRISARRISDAVIAATAEHAGCAWIATFDEAFRSPTLPAGML